MNTRDPDELLHDARMMEVEMKEQTGHTHCPRCNTWVEDMNAHRCGMTDQELEEIEEQQNVLVYVGPFLRSVNACGEPWTEQCGRATRNADRAHADIATLLAEVRALRAENARLLDACKKTEHEVQQILGRALGYPRFADDQKNFPGTTDADGVCVGDHVAATLAKEAAKRIARLREVAGELHDALAMVEDSKEMRPASACYAKWGFDPNGTTCIEFGEAMDDKRRAALAKAKEVLE